MVKLPSGFGCPLCKQRNSVSTAVHTVLLKSTRFPSSFGKKVKLINKITFKNCSQHVLQRVKAQNGHLKGTSSSDLQAEHWYLPRAQRDRERKRERKREGRND